MPDAATWFLTLSAPATAAAVAVWINGTRIEQDRRAARYSAVRELLDECGKLLTTALHDPSSVPTPAHLAHTGLGGAGSHGLMLKSRLLLWFDEGHPVLISWTHAITGLAFLELQSPNVGEAQGGTETPVGIWWELASRSGEARRDYVRHLGDTWFAAARGYLLEEMPSSSWTTVVGEHFRSSQIELDG
jgi:hypothetical protein